MTIADERALSAEYVALAKAARSLAERCRDTFGSEGRCAGRAVALATECEALARLTNPDRTARSLPPGTTRMQVR
jgi:hypothetical protein